jgi:tRNA modification GTPase
MSSLIDRPLMRIVYGRWGSDPAEDVIVCRRNEQCVEVHCHGGQSAMRRIIDDLLNRDSREESWHHWVAGHESSAIRAAARQELARATTARSAEILLDQFDGALEAAVRGIVQLIEERCDDLSAVAARIEILLDRAPLGLHLTQPWRVVVAGPPNVGKSSLVNALVGYQRTIVFDQPGTTRDVVTALTALSGWPIEFCDTAGWRNSNDPLETAGVQRAMQQAGTADCLLLMFDLSQPWTNEQQQLVDQWPQAIIVHNKCDLAKADHRAKDEETSVVTSTITGEGIDLLTRKIVQHLVPIDPAPRTAVPFTVAQVERLQAATAALKAVDAPAARRHLLALLASA